MAPDLDVCGGTERSQQSIADDVHKHWEAVDGLHVAKDGKPVALAFTRYFNGPIVFQLLCDIFLACNFHCEILALKSVDEVLNA